MSDTLETVRASLMQTLQIVPERLPGNRDFKLLGSIPEFDSMAVLAVLTDLEERLDLEFEDDDISAEIFESLGTLVDFVESNLAIQ